MVHRDLPQHAAKSIAVYASETDIYENNIERPLAGDSHSGFSICRELRIFEDGVQDAFHGPAGQRVVVNGQDSDRPLERRFALRPSRAKLLENLEGLGGCEERGL